MKYIKLIFIIVPLLEGCDLWENISGKSNILPNQYAVLDSTQAYASVNQCSRYAPKIEGSWNPSPKQIQELEIHIQDILKLTADSCCLGGVKINDLNDYYRQYVGIIVKGKKLIYINAFPIDEIKHFNSFVKFDYKKEAFIACDGGKSFWGVSYDPVNKKFFDLAFNGVA